MDWWYARAYPGGQELMDPATRVLVPWLRAQGGTRWFFIRYWDMTGHHLRLRLQAPPDEIDRVHERVPELRALIDTLRPEPEDRLVTGDFPGPLPAHRAVRTGLYAPEFGKYGGAAGVALAEDLFTRASAWYADNDLTKLARSTDRAWLAVAYLRSVVAAALPPGEKDAFWAAHRRHWGWQLRLAVPDQGRLRELVGRTVASVEPPALDVGELVSAVVETLDQAGMSRAHLLLQYVHMDLNRWGFVPAEECLLGLIAAH
ncbi:lantibiotic dehydratase C-terminal domain-containing protein [Nonomuraea sp. NPDC050536]|uniref:lantibiotic dehydratase C-terminal domain-containing protein n=1 Tax=Nonomuraea sp. NPDC050536 TaxID=3364366 RepID=UPI0037C7993E